MRKLLTLFALSFLLVSSAYGQTVSDIEKNFTKTGQSNQYAYNDISITVKFDKDGQICKAAFPSTAYTDKVVTVGISKIKGEEIKEILNLVAPSTFRGKPIWSFFNTELFGRSGATDYEYENVQLTTYFALERKEKSELNAEIKENDSKIQTDETVLLDNQDDLLSKVKDDKSPITNILEKKRQSEEILSADVAVIVWKNRQCIE